MLSRTNTKLASWPVLAFLFLPPSNTLVVIHSVLQRSKVPGGPYTLTSHSLVSHLAIALAVTSRSLIPVHPRQRRHPVHQSLPV